MYGKDQLACISWSFCIWISCESFNWFSKPFKVFSNSETLAVASWSLAVKELKLESVAVSPFMRSLSSADLASSALSNCFVPLRSCCNEEFLAWDLFSSSFTSDSLFESAFSASFYKKNWNQSNSITFYHEGTHLENGWHQKIAKKRLIQFKAPASVEKARNDWDIWLLKILMSWGDLTVVPSFLFSVVCCTGSEMSCFWYVKTQERRIEDTVWILSSK